LRRAAIGVTSFWGSGMKRVGRDEKIYRFLKLKAARRRKRYLEQLYRNIGINRALPNIEDGGSISRSPQLGTANGCSCRFGIHQKAQELTVCVDPWDITQGEEGQDKSAMSLCTVDT
jgi:hypothetical protein